MATKFKTKSTITHLVSEISPRRLHLTEGSPGQAIKWCQSNFKRSDAGCHGNKIWDHIGYNSVCILWDIVKQQI